jgi:hypothetical protein
MTTTMFPGHCQSDHHCDRTPCFQARLEARGALSPVRKNADLCAEHLGDVVLELTAWAHSSGLTDGQVTVLILDPAPGEQLVSPVACHGEPSEGLPFGTIPLNR